MSERNKLVFASLLTVSTVFAYLTFRYILELKNLPGITYELTAAIIGVIFTVIITNILINNQTEAELRKEENIKFLDLKSKIYLELMDNLKEVMLKKKIEPDDIIAIRLLNQKLAFVASEDVIREFNNFSKTYAEIAKDGNVNEQEIDSLFNQLTKLSVLIREDLFNDANVNIKEITNIQRYTDTSNKNLDLD
ncbi:MAG: hypothetical protein D6707_09330 [Bacteroidetes bacterium]|nr:MAG: hypothetical protein D6707_09330 [Bacteroidota bacterium]